MSEAAVKQIVLASRPKGLPTRENFRLEQVPMPELPQGGLLLRVLSINSIDCAVALSSSISNTRMLVTLPTATAQNRHVAAAARGITPWYAAALHLVYLLDG
jgi:NADPH-dependent curcumin reductase CurA